MREMGFMLEAEPLVNATSTAILGADGDGIEGFEVAYGWESPEGTATWESRSMFGCVCDSSWEVSWVVTRPTALERPKEKNATTACHPLWKANSS